MKLKKSVKEKVIIGTFYLVIILGIIVLNARLNQLNQQKMTESVAMNQSKWNIKIKILTTRLYHLI